MPPRTTRLKLSGRNPSGASRWMRLALVLLCLTLSSSASAQTVEDQIRAEVRRYVDATNGGDPNAVAALYLATTAATSVGDGEMYRGWQAIADILRQAYAQDNSIQMSVDSVAVLRLGTDAAVATMRYRRVLRGPPAQTFTGAMTLVYLRTPGGWRDHQPRESRGTYVDQSGDFQMTLPRIMKQPSASLPLAMSCAALATVLLHIARFGVVREPDEGTAAHIWQLLMAAQVPIIGFFAIKWLPRAPKEALPVLALQVVAVLAALAPVFLLKL